MISKRIHSETAPRIVCEFREIWPSETGKVVSRQRKNFGSLSRSLLCANCAQNLPEPAADNILAVPQISSKSVHFRRSYSMNIVETRRAGFSLSRALFRKNVGAPS